MKLCKNCRFCYGAVALDTWRCAHPAGAPPNDPSPVDNKPSMRVDRNAYCGLARKEDGFCGPDAKYFEQGHALGNLKRQWSTAA